MLYDRNHEPTQVAGAIWGLIDTYIHSHLSAIQIDLASPVSELKAFLKSLFPPELKNRAEHMLKILLTTETIQPDMIRQQFVAAWKNLRPVFRHHLGGRPSGNPVGYLAFFTASDALVALDRIGPQLGIEFSREGLIRLARLLAGQQPATLAYGSEVDPNLRRMLGFDPEPVSDEPVFKGEELELEAPDDQSSLESEHSVLKILNSLLISTA